MPPASLKLSRYGSFNSWDGMKLLALLLMLIDHAGYFYFTDCMLLRALGRGAAPVFLFLTGFAPSHRLKPDLLAGAGIMVLSSLAVGGHGIPLGILCTIIIGRLIVKLLDSGKLKIRRVHEWLVILVFFSAPSSYLFEDGTFGLMFVLCGYLQQHKERYPERMRKQTLTFVSGFAMLWNAVLFNMNIVDAIIAATVLGGVGILMWRMQVKPVSLPKPLLPAEPALRLASRYTLWIYVVHFCVLQLLTGKHY